MSSMCSTKQVPGGGSNMKYRNTGTRYAQGMHQNLGMHVFAKGPTWKEPVPKHGHKQRCTAVRRGNMAMPGASDQLEAPNTPMRVADAVQNMLGTMMYTAITLKTHGKSVHGESTQQN